jgi:hypothetical protein
MKIPNHTSSSTPRPHRPIFPIAPSLFHPNHNHDSTPNPELGSIDPIPDLDTHHTRTITKLALENLAKTMKPRTPKIKIKMGSQLNDVKMGNGLIKSDQEKILGKDPLGRMR